MAGELDTGADTGSSALNLHQAADQLDGLDLLGEGTPEGDEPLEDGDEGEGIEPIEDDGEELLEDELDEGDDSDLDDLGDEDNQTGVTAKSLDDVAQQMNLTPEQLDGLEISFKAAGQDMTVNLAELRAGYQKDADYRRNTHALAEQRRAAEAQHAQNVQESQTQMVALGQLFANAKNVIAGDANSPAMQQLRTANPAEWSAQMREFEARTAQIDQALGQIAQQYNGVQQQQLHQSQEQLAQLKQTEAARLRELVPDWNDQTGAEVSNYLSQSFGFGADELNDVADARMVMIAHKAMLYDAQQAASSQVKKKVQKLPKAQAPGKGTPSKSRTRRGKMQQAKNKLRKTGSRRDAANLIGQLDLP